MAEQPDPKVPMPVFTVEVRCSRLLSGEQHNTLDNLVQWSARTSPEAGLKLVDAITDILQNTLPGALTPISESGARALYALGKHKQLPLLACELPNESGKE
jgi:hypothetical protein